MATRRTSIRLTPVALVRRAVVVVALLVLAYFGGSWLGKFTVAGLSVRAPDQPALTLDQALADLAARSTPARKRAEAATSQSVPAPDIAAGYQGHVCEGCDAQLPSDDAFGAYLAGAGDVAASSEALPQDARPAQGRGVRPLVDRDDDLRRQAAPSATMSTAGSSAGRTAKDNSRTTGP